MKTFSFILVSTFFAYLLAQDCNNPLLNVFNLTGLQAPEPGNGLPFCSNLQNGQTCCSAETVQTFQTRLDNLTSSLQALAGDRDVYMTELFANYSNDFQSVADDLTDFSEDIDILQRDDPELGNEVRYQYNGLNRIARALDNIDDHFRSNVQEYQQRRTACFNTILQVQSSAWCLACDPTYASIGVQPDGSVNTAPEVCNSIQQSCAPYLDRTGYFNPLFQAGQAYQRLVNLTRYLRDYKNNNHVIPQDVVLENDILVPVNDTQRTSAIPPNCTNETCDWQCSNFFSPSFVLNESIVANGGGILGGDDVNYTAIGAQVNDTVAAPNDTTTVIVDNTTTTVTEVPETIPLGAGFSAPGRLLRQLQESLWTPDLSATGLAYNVVDDPADIAAIWNNNPIFDDSSDGPTDGDNTETDNDDFTDNDGVDTTGNGEDDTDFDGIDTTGNNNTYTDNDGIDTTDADNTDNDGIDTTGNNNDNTNPTNPTNDDDNDNTNPTNPTNQDDNDDTDN